MKVQVTMSLTDYEEIQSTIKDQLSFIEILRVILKRPEVQDAIRKSKKKNNTTIIKFLK